MFLFVYFLLHQCQVIVFAAGGTDFVKVFLSSLEKNVFAAGSNVVSRLEKKETLYVRSYHVLGVGNVIFLLFFQETLDEWQACQRTWMYLESIFGSPDIVRQLPAAAKLFQAVDKSWRHIMVLTADEPLAIKQVCCRVAEVNGCTVAGGVTSVVAYPKDS